MVIIPLFCYKGYRQFPSPFFSILIMLSFISIFFAFIFTIALFVVAHQRFHNEGFEASYGPSVSKFGMQPKIWLMPLQFWMALVTFLIITLLMMNTGCGNMCRGRFGRASENVAYNLWYLPRSSKVCVDFYKCLVSVTRSNRWSVSYRQLEWRWNGILVHTFSPYTYLLFRIIRIIKWV